MDRLRQFLTHQAAAFGALFVRRKTAACVPTEISAEKTAPQRPSALRLV